MHNSFHSVTHATFSSLGGAGAVAVRLALAQRKLGWTSTLRTLTDGPFSTWAPQHPLIAASALIDYFLVRKTNRGSFFSLLRNQHNLTQSRAIASEPHVLHLHWLPGFIRAEDLLAVAHAKTIVWSLQDFFPVTGGCHYPYGCVRFAENCQGCPQVHDICRTHVARAFNRKRNAYRNNHKLVLVTPSRWAQAIIQSSSATRNVRCDVIPNPVDTSVFAPCTSPSLMKTCGFPENCFVIGVGAADLREERKQIPATLKIISEWIRGNREPQRFHVLVFGTGSVKNFRKFGPQFHFVGGTNNPKHLADWYRRMDVYLSLSQYETFGNTLAEAAACGTPAICLAGSGMSEVVLPDETGFHIRDKAELPAALLHLSRDREKLYAMSQAARRHAVTSFDDEVIARRFISLYRGHT